MADGSGPGLVTKWELGVALSKIGAATAVGGTASGGLADNAPDAYEKVVDRLLASPQYGERFGRHWLDVARYGEDQAHSFQPRLYPQGFRYRDYGNLATIGRKAAVVDLSVPGLGALRFSGLLAWLFWLFAHIYFLIGFRNRLMVMIDWAWSYTTYERNARVVAEPRFQSRGTLP